MSDTIYTKETEIEDLTIRTRHVLDDLGDISYLGEFSDRCGEFKFNPTYEVARNVGTDRDGYCYYTPPIAVEHNRKYYRKAGYSKHEAYTKARAIAFKTMDRLIGLYDGDWFYMGIVVEVLYKGRVIGSSGLWMIESDSDSEYIESVENSLMVEAVAESNEFRKSLASLK